MQALGAMSGMEGMNVMGDLGGISQDMSLEDGDYRDEYDDQAFADDSLGLSDAPGQRGSDTGGGRRGGGGGGGGGGNRVRRHGKGSRYGRGKGFHSAAKGTGGGGRGPKQ
jgi:hypothetical protein